MAQVGHYRLVFSIDTPLLLAVRRGDSGSDSSFILELRRQIRPTVLRKSHPLFHQTQH
jgi:hypothetical protein